MKFWFKKGAWASNKAYKIIDCMEPERIKSIAVIRHAALGDMLLTRPFFIEVKKAFPNASVTISVVDHYKRGIPEDLVNRIHVIYRRDLRKHSLKEKISNIRELGQHDIIFDLSATPRSKILCLLNKAKLKIGFPYRNIYRHLFYDVAIFRSDFTFEADLMLQMLNLFGIKTTYPPEFNMTHKPVKKSTPYVVYFPEASTPLKCWPLDYFKQLIIVMSKEYPDHDHIVLKGIGDWELITKILEGLNNQSNILSVEINDLDETISFIQGAVMLISNDTGIRHIGIAAQTPTVGIFFGRKKGSTQPYRYWPRYGLHDIVYALDGTKPSVSDVFGTAKCVMREIQAAKKMNQKGLK